MSNCKVTININGKQLRLNLDNSQASTIVDIDLIQALASNEKVRKQLIEEIKNQVLDSGIKETKIEDIKTKGIQANCDLRSLRDNPIFSKITFPDGNVKILLINNLVINGKSMFGRIINSNGEEVFVIKNSDQDIIKLTNFLKARNTIREYGLNITKKSPFYFSINEIYKKIKEKDSSITSIDNMFIDYLTNKEKYRNIRIKDDNGNVYSSVYILEQFLRNFQDYQVNNNFDDPFTQTLMYVGSFQGNGILSLELKDFYNLFSTYHKELLDSMGISSFEKFKNLNTDMTVSEFVDTYIENNKDSENAVKIDDSFKKEKSIFGVLLKMATQIEPDFTYGYDNYDNKTIQLKQLYTPISDKYGIAYDTIQEMTIHPYKGYYIYEDKNNENVFISRGSLTPSESSKNYNSVQEAQLDIDTALSNQYLNKNSLEEFKFQERSVDSNGNVVWENTRQEEVRSKAHFNQGQVIEILDIPLYKNGRSQFAQNEYLGDKYKLVDFANIVNLWNISNKAKESIINDMDTPEKAVTYLYKVNEQFVNGERNNEKELLKIAEQINNAGKKYYYIEKAKYGTRTNTYQLVPATFDYASEEKVDQKEPVVQWMSAIGTALSNQFNVNFNLVTSEEIAKDETLSKAANPNLDKAFILNGQVYVNTSIASTTDLIHEYIHLILGVLKSNPKLKQNYENLLMLLKDTDEGNFTLTQLKERYPGLSQVDLLEETFAKLFSKWVRHNVTMDTAKVFEASEGDLKTISESIFNKGLSITDLKEFFGTKTISIFKRFNTEVSKLLSEGNDLNFENAQQSRKISNYITDKIKNKEITEKC